MVAHPKRDTISKILYSKCKASVIKCSLLVLELLLKVFRVYSELVIPNRSRHN